ncbi:hypothetical protein B1H26_34750 [Amycolatopsis sp. BJA-103]|nr:hypothetical protein B1H26_34750 [Amycolatopsis sp. BJA-103]
MPQPQHHEVLEFGLFRPPRAQGEFVEAVETSGRGEPESHRPPRFVGLDGVPHRSVPAHGSRAEWPVEPQRRPRVDGPQPVVVGGQCVDQRAHPLRRHRDNPGMPVPHSHRASLF